MMFEDRKIVDSAEYGVHIGLTCKNHTNLRWSTKNIDRIGARTIFYDGDVDDMGQPECSCHMNDLYPIPN